MRKAPNEAAAASFRGFGRAITSIKVKTKIHRVRTTQSSSSEKAEGPLLWNDPSASNCLPKYSSLFSNFSLDDPATSALDYLPNYLCFG
jgi:hypothetical protein